MMSPEVITGINELSTLITGLGILVAAIVSLISPIRKWLVSKLSSKNEIQEALDAIKVLSDKFDSESKRNELNEKATLSLTRNALTRIYYKALERGGISAYDRENFLKMYDSYSALGGNSYIHELYEQVLKMPSLSVVAMQSKKAPRTRKPTTRRTKK